MQKNQIISQQFIQIDSNLNQLKVLSQKFSNIKSNQPKTYGSYQNNNIKEKKMIYQQQAQEIFQTLYLNLGNIENAFFIEQSNQFFKKNFIQLEKQIQQSFGNMWDVQEISCQDFEFILSKLRKYYHQPNKNEKTLMQMLEDFQVNLKFISKNCELKKPEGYVDRHFDQRYKQGIEEFYQNLFFKLNQMKNNFKGQRQGILQVIDSVNIITQKEKKLKEEFENALKIQMQKIKQKISILKYENQSQNVQLLSKVKKAEQKAEYRKEKIKEIFGKLQQAIENKNNNKMYKNFKEQFNEKIFIKEKRMQNEINEKTLTLQQKLIRLSQKLDKLVKLQFNKKITKQNLNNIQNFKTINQKNKLITPFNNNIISQKQMVPFNQMENQNISDFSPIVQKYENKQDYQEMFSIKNNSKFERLKSLNVDDIDKEQNLFYDNKCFQTPRRPSNKEYKKFYSQFQNERDQFQDSQSQLKRKKQEFPGLETLLLLQNNSNPSSSMRGSKSKQQDKLFFVKDNFNQKSLFKNNNFDKLKKEKQQLQAQLSEQKLKLNKLKLLEDSNRKYKAIIESVLDVLRYQNEGLCQDIEEQLRQDYSYRNIETNFQKLFEQKEQQQYQQIDILNQQSKSLQYQITRMNEYIQEQANKIQILQEKLTEQQNPKTYYFLNKFLKNGDNIIQQIDKKFQKLSDLNSKLKMGIQFQRNELETQNDQNQELQNQLNVQQQNMKELNSQLIEQQQLCQQKTESLNDLEIQIQSKDNLRKSLKNLQNSNQGLMDKYSNQIAVNNKQLNEIEQLKQTIQDNFKIQEKQTQEILQFKELVNNKYSSQNIDIEDIGTIAQSGVQQNLNYSLSNQFCLILKNQSSQQNINIPIQDSNKIQHIYSNIYQNKGDTDELINKKIQDYEQQIIKLQNERDEAINEQNFHLNRIQNLENLINLENEDRSEHIRKCLTRSLIDSMSRESRKNAQIIKLKNTLSQKQRKINLLKTNKKSLIEKQDIDIAKLNSSVLLDDKNDNKLVQILSKSLAPNDRVISSSVLKDLDRIDQPNNSKRQINDKNKQIKNFQKKINHLKEYLKEVEDQNQMIKENLYQLEEQHEDLKQDNKVLNERMIDDEMKINDKNEKIKLLKKEVEDLQQQIEDLKQKNQDIQQENQDLQQQLSDEEEDNKDNELFIELIKNKVKNKVIDVNNFLESKNKNLNELEQFQIILQGSQQKLQDINQKLAVFKNISVQFQQQKQSNQKLIYDNEILNNKIKNLEQQNIKIKDLEQKNETVQEIKESNLMLENQLKNLEQSNIILKKDLDQNTLLKQKNIELIEQNKNLAEKIREQKDINAFAEKESIILLDKFNQNEIAIDQVKRKSIRQTKRVQDLFLKLENIKSITMSLNKINQKNENQKNKVIKSMKKQQDKYQQEIDEKKLNIQQLQCESEAKQISIQKLEEKNQSQINLISSLQNKSQDNQEMNQHYQQIIQEKDQLQKNLKDQKDQTDNLQKINKDFQTKLEELKEKNIELENQIEFLNEKLNLQNEIVQSRKSITQNLQQKMDLSNIQNQDLQEQIKQLEQIRNEQEFEILDLQSLNQQTKNKNIQLRNKLLYINTQQKNYKDIFDQSMYNYSNKQSQLNEQIMKLQKIIIQNQQKSQDSVQNNKIIQVEIDTIQQEIQTLRQQSQQDQIIIKDMEQNNQENILQIEQLQQEIKESITDKEILEQNCQNLQDKILELQQEKEQNQQSQEEILEQQELEIEQKTNEYDELYKQKEIIQQQLQQLQQKQEIKQNQENDQVKDLTQQKEQIQQQLQQLQQQYEIKQSNNNEQIMELSSQKEQLQQQLVQLQQEVEIKQNQDSEQIKELSQQKEQLQQELEIKQNQDSEQINELSQQKEQLQQQLEQLQQELEIKQNQDNEQINELSQQKQQSYQQLEQLQQKLEIEQSQNNDQIKKQNLKIEELKILNDKILKEKEIIIEQLEIKELKIKNLEEQNFMSKENDFESKQKQQDQQNSLQSEIQNLTSQISKQQLQLDQLNKEIIELKNNILDKNKYIGKLKLLNIKSKQSLKKFYSNCTKICSDQVQQASSQKFFQVNKKLIDIRRILSNLVDKMNNFKIDNQEISMLRETISEIEASQRTSIMDLQFEELQSQLSQKDQIIVDMKRNTNKSILTMEKKEDVSKRQIRELKQYIQDKEIIIQQLTQGKNSKSQLKKSLAKYVQISQQLKRELENTKFQLKSLKDDLQAQKDIHRQSALAYGSSQKELSQLKQQDQKNQDKLVQFQDMYNNQQNIIDIVQKSLKLKDGFTEQQLQQVINDMQQHYYYFEQLKNNLLDTTMIQRDNQSSFKFICEIIQNQDESLLLGSNKGSQVFDQQNLQEYQDKIDQLIKENQELREKLKSYSDMYGSQIRRNSELIESQASFKEQPLKKFKRILKDNIMIFFENVMRGIRNKENLDELMLLLEFDNKEKQRLLEVLENGYIEEKLSKSLKITF